MRHFLLISLLSLISSLSIAADLEPRVAELEKRVTELEKMVAQKLSRCETKYLHHSYRLNHCDRGTFASAVMPVGDGNLQLACGYYQLQCFTSPNQE